MCVCVLFVNTKCNEKIIVCLHSISHAFPHHNVFMNAMQCTVARRPRSGYSELSPAAKVEAEVCAVLSMAVVFLFFFFVFKSCGLQPSIDNLQPNYHVSCCSKVARRRVLFLEQLFETSKARHGRHTRCIFTGCSTTFTCYTGVEVECGHGFSGLWMVRVEELQRFTPHSECKSPLESGQAHSRDCHKTHARAKGFT